METKIIQKLKEVEREHQVEVLFAIESGSRAWGFASPDSDYDIRFVYRHKKDWYLNLWEQKDTIQFMTEDDLDGSGWDIRKALLLLSKTNASFLGWLFSPVVYSEKEGMLEEFRKLAIENFNPVAAFYHYHSMNKGFDEVLSKKQVNIKRFFYFFRTALCANWIAHEKGIPPVAFQELYELIPEKCQAILNGLIVQKSKAGEKSDLQIPAKIVALAKQLVVENETKKDQLKKEHINYEDFDVFFKKKVG